MLCAGLVLCASAALTPAAGAKNPPTKCPDFTGGPGGGAPQGSFENIRVSGVSCRLADQLLVGFTRNPPGAPGCSRTDKTCAVDLRGGVFEYNVKPALPVPGKLRFVGKSPKYKGDTVTATAVQ
jgi:hypothetical protein